MQTTKIILVLKITEHKNHQVRLKNLWYKRSKFRINVNIYMFLNDSIIG